MRKKRLLITGAGGLVGSALCRIFLENFQEKYEVIPVFSDDYDLTKNNEVKALFYETEPEMVIHTAGRVGGIGRNLAEPIEQYEKNILMNTHVLHESLTFCEKIITFGTICAFPENIDFYQESDLHKGEPFPAHRSYAYAKRMMDIQITAWQQACPELYGKVCSVIPTNIFGSNDNYDLKNGHVVPMLIHKCFLAKQENKPLEIWGDGSPYREFIYSDDLARICFDLLEKNEMPSRLITSYKEFQIKEVVQMICNAFDHQNVIYDTTKPNGQMRRQTSKELFNKIFPGFKFTNMELAIKHSVEWFQQNYPNIRGVL